MAPHLRLIDEAICRLVNRDIPQRVLVVRLPPRHGKSELVSHWTATWHKRVFPAQHVLLASYEATFAASWGRKVRQSFIEVGMIGRDVFFDSLKDDHQAVNDWATSEGGYMATSGVGGPVTGKGFHLGIVDDLVKNAEQAQSETYREKIWEWLTSTFWTRREPDGVMICVGTPWHRDDWLARLRNWNEPIHEINLPAVAEDNDPLRRQPGQALWPERFDERTLEHIRLAQGPYYWSALYQQRPSLHEHAEWPESYFADHIWADDWRGPFELSAAALDPSKGKDQKRGDYAAAVFVGLKGGKLWVDCWIDRRPVDVIVATTIEHTAEWQPDIVGLETNAWQELLAPEFDRQCQARRMLPLAIQPIENTVKKEVRIGRIGPYLARRQIIFRDTKHCRLLVEQLKDFPLGDHDDGPDALEMAIRLLARMAGSSGGQDYSEHYVGVEA